MGRRWRRSAPRPRPRLGGLTPIHPARRARLLPGGGPAPCHRAAPGCGIRIRYDERDVRRPRAPRLAGALALPRDRPRRVGASGGRDGAAAVRDRDRADPRARRPARHGRGRARSTCRCRGCCRCTPRPTKRLGADTSAFLGEPDTTTPFVVGVAGSVAVGKSTIARLLRELMSRWPDTPARRAGDDRRLPLPERRARAARAHGAQGLPRVVRPARARVVPHRGQERRRRGAGAVLLAHALRHRARRARHRAPAGCRDRRGAQRAAAAARAERRRGERAVRLLDLRGCRHRRTSRSGSSTASWRCAAGAFATRTRSSTCSPTSPTRRRSQTAHGLLERHQPAEPRWRTCCPTKHRATLVLQKAADHTVERVLLRKL